MSAGMSRKVGLVFLNLGLFNYDGALDMSQFLSNSTVAATVFDSCVGCSDRDLLARIGDSEIIVTKEMPLSAELIKQLPHTAKCIMEAGTGFNNIPVEACKEKGISVMNVGAYSAEAVASLVITHMLNHASGILAQQRMLLRGDRSNFLEKLSVPCFELAGKTLGLIGAYTHTR